MVACRLGSLAVGSNVVLVALARTIWHALSVAITVSWAIVHRKGACGATVTLLAIAGISTIILCFAGSMTITVVGALLINNNVATRFAAESWVAFTYIGLADTISSAVIGALGADLVTLVTTETRLAPTFPGTRFKKGVLGTTDSMTCAEVKLSWALRNLNIASKTGPIVRHAVALGWIGRDITESMTRAVVWAGNGGVNATTVKSLVTNITRAHTTKAGTVTLAVAWAVVGWE